MSSLDDLNCFCQFGGIIHSEHTQGHKSSMIKGAVPRSGIDTDPRLGFSHSKGWIFGYKLHITASTGSLIIPLSADFTQADVQKIRHKTYLQFLFQ